MTTTYDPQHPAYLDEADTRREMSRVFDVCRECRACVELCPSFPALFDTLDRLGGQDAGMMTPAEQDHVVDGCTQCKLCQVRCPYPPGVHEAAVDFPRLMLRARTVRGGGAALRSVVARTVARRGDLIGALATRAAGPVNAVADLGRGAGARRLASRVLGVSAERRLPRFAQMRFTAWFARRPRVRVANKQGSVVVYPTSLVEYRSPEVGAALVKVFEHNGVQCDVGPAHCCGAPLLHEGDLRGFTRVAVDNVARLAEAVRRGADVVVAQPECTHVVRRDYVDYVGGPLARLVAAHTYDAAEYLMNLHLAEGTALDTNFAGDVPRTVAYQSSGHLRTLGIDGKGRDLVKLTGARVTLIDDESGGVTTQSLRTDAHDDSAFTRRLVARLTATGADAVVGDCHRANSVIAGGIGRPARHPMEVIADAYGLDVHVGSPHGDGAAR